MKRFFGKSLLATLAAVAALAIPAMAMAFTSPSSGSLAYEVYDIAVNEMLKGPVGYVGGLGLIAFGLYSGVMGKGQISTAMLSILGGGALANADSITNSLGALM